MPPRKVPADWSWVSEIQSAADITTDHVRRAAGLQNLCSCAGKKCVSPFCKNFKVKEVQIQSLEDVPEREKGHPVGLRNLGATCYANAFIQVWFQDRILRAGVYGCKPSSSNSPIHHLAVTFAALEHSTKSYYNPASLVESLRLEKGSQQDASEFSKLFMSLLSQELDSQVDPVARTLIKDRFEGRLAYSTLCKGCGADSERENAFTELELGLAKDESLSDRLEALLADELLDGDNKYRCSQCNNLCPAKRRIKLKKLPPVLSFSLLRFVFDPFTLNRKKCKDKITFPGLIDMGKYVKGSGAAWYELGGIVTHHGTNAQSGHFVCEVYDVEQDKWFLFNDEEVEEITKPGNMQDKVMLKMTNGKLNVNKKRAQDASSDDASEKRQKISAEIPERKGAVKLSVMNQHSSKDAYLLLYTRCGIDTVSASVQQTEPSPEVLAEVRRMNDDFEEQAQMRKDEEAALDCAAIQLQQARNSVVELLSAANEVPEHVVSTADVQEWLDEEVHLPDQIGSPATEVRPDGEVKTVEVDENGGVGGSGHITVVDEAKEDIAMAAVEVLKRASDPELPAKGTKTEEDRVASLCHAAFTSTTLKQVDNSHLACEHGSLSPWATSNYKLVSTSAQQYLGFLGYSASPSFSIGNLCQQCIVDEYECRKIKSDRAEETRRFAQLDNVDGEIQYIVSRVWLSGWRKGILPLNQDTGRPLTQNVDPYKDDIYCEHGLTSEEAKVQTISAAAYAYLQELLPGFEALAADAPPCNTCSDPALLDEARVQESVAQAKLEKNRLKFLNTANLNDKTTYSMNEPVYLVPCDFIDQWRAWQQCPQRKPRPILDTSSLFCEHALLRFDPAHTSLKPPVCWKIPEPLWEVLIELYGNVQDICFTKITSKYGSESKCNAEPCDQCRQQEAFNFTSAKIIVNFALSNKAGSNVSRARSSRRPIQITVVKGDTVMDMKQKIAQGSRVQVWLQRLFLRGKELVDAEEPTTAIGLTSTDRLVLIEVAPPDDDFEILDDCPSSRQTNDGEGGFSGTALIGGSLAKPEADLVMSKECQACTFSNDPARTVCEMCEARL